MKIENPSLALLVIIGTGLLARVAAQGIERALFSTVIQYWLTALSRSTGQSA
jgi:hypothetical protein